MSSVEILCDARDRVGESPVWSVREQALYWVDIEGRQIRRFDWAARSVQSWPTTERVGCIALDARGGLIAAAEHGIDRVALATSPAPSLERIASVTHAADGMRFNDGRTDRQGRFWAGTMVMDMALASPKGALYRLDAQGLSAPRFGGLITPNGLAFSPDGRTLYLSDSHPAVQAVWQFDYDTDTGTPTRRRLFIDMKQHPGRPDGAAVDEDGAYWICGNDAGLVHRFTPEGVLDRSIRVPVSKPSMCAFGGPQLDLLFVTSIQPAQPNTTERELAGAVFCLTPGTRGLPEAAFLH